MSGPQKFVEAEPVHAPDAAHRSDDPDTKRLEKRIYQGVLAAVVAWGGSVAIWGIPGLYIPALMLVPVIVAVLFIITRG
jgi:fatty acid desaturase